MGYYFSKLVDEELNNLKNKVLDIVLKEKGYIPIGYNIDFDASKIPKQLGKLSKQLQFKEGTKIRVRIKSITGMRGLNSLKEDWQVGIDLSKINTLEREVAFYMSIGDSFFDFEFYEGMPDQNGNVTWGSNPLQISIPLSELSLRVTIRFVFDYDHVDGEGVVCLRVNDINLTSNYGENASPTIHFNPSKLIINGGSSSTLNHIARTLAKLDFHNDYPGMAISAILGSVGVWNIVEDKILDMLNEQIEGQEVAGHRVTVSINCGRIKNEMFNATRLDGDERKKIKLIRIAECKEKKKNDPSLDCRTPYRDQSIEPGITFEKRYPQISTKVKNLFHLLGLD